MAALNSDEEKDAIPKDSQPEPTRAAGSETQTWQVEGEYDALDKPNRILGNALREKERDKQLKYEIQVLRFGDFAVVGDICSVETSKPWKQPFRISLMIMNQTINFR